mgnify:CR=1 FL=1
MTREDLEVRSLAIIPIVHAAWCRYLLGIDDEGKDFERSADPRLAEMDGRMAGMQLGQTGPFHGQLRPILSDPTIFGVDLYEAGLGERVEGYFTEMMAGPGAIRKTLHKYLA